MPAAWVMAAGGPCSRSITMLCGAEIARCEGTEVDTAGDGFFVRFDSPARALDCARAAREAVKRLGIDIRVGIHTGECDRQGRTLTGMAVHVAERIQGLAGPGDILVSSTVKDIVVGSDARFEDRGQHSLKGMPGEWRLFSLADYEVSRRLAAQPSQTPARGPPTRRFGMKIVIIGGTGLIGSKTVPILRQGGHEVVAASPNTGVNSITGEGLKEAMAGTQVVIDLANSPSFEDKAVLEFFETSGRNLLAAEAAAGVRHHVALSIVGTDRTPDNGYFRAKVAQEKLIEASGIPYTIIRSTQFLEFLGGIAAEATQGNKVRISPGLFQPIAAEDVAPIVAEVALAAPANGIVEIAGPDRAPFNEIVARYLKGIGDPREVVKDPAARYFGGLVEERSLVPLGEARLGRIGFDEWVRRSRPDRKSTR